MINNTVGNPLASNVVTLYNGVKIPTVGLGTWQTKGDETIVAVKHALASGYRHIDTAAIYRNEAAVASAIKESGVPRNEIFITSKVPPTHQGSDKALRCFEKTLSDLDTTYVDLYLIHWPGTAKLKLDDERNISKRIETWRALEKLYKEGKCRAIGVSNFQKSHLEHLLQVCDVKPAVNQIEFHPLLYPVQRELVEFCHQNGIVVQAYSPLAVGKLVDDPEVVEIARWYEKNHSRNEQGDEDNDNDNKNNENNRSLCAQVALRWAIQHNAVVLPKSSKPERISANVAGLFDFVLSEQHMRQLDTRTERAPYNGKPTRCCWDPSNII